MLRLTLAALTGGMLATVAAADGDAMLQPPTGWSDHGRVAVSAASVATSNADTSLDPQVRTAQNSTTISGSLDSTLWWRGSETADEIEQQLHVRYGRNRTGDGDWNESNDSFLYEGVWRHRYHPRRAYYLSAVDDAAIIGPSPNRDAFDPMRTALATGHSWIADNILPLSDRLEARAGIRAQRRWGRSLDAYRRQTETGPEAWLRYERQQTPELSYWAGGDIFAEFDDPTHMQTQVNAGLHLQITSLLAVDLHLRMAYESSPNDIPDSASTTGYNHLGIREETLVSLTYGW